MLIGLCAIALIVAVIFLRSALVDGFHANGENASAPFTPPAVTCDANYAGGCVPQYPPDVDCDDLEALGISEVTVTGSDPHDLDPDGDGVGCN